MAVQAQTNHLQETLQAQKEKLEQLHMDAREHLNESLDRKERILLSRVDTNYIGLLPRSWRVLVHLHATVPDIGDAAGFYLQLDRPSVYVFVDDQQSHL